SRRKRVGSLRRVDRHDDRPAVTSAQIAGDTTDRVEQSTSLERRGAQLEDRPAGIVERGAGQLQRTLDRLAGAGRFATLGERLRGFEVERDGGEGLRERVVQVARDPVALLYRRQRGAAIGEPRALDRQADQRAD